ncbi:C4-dicarboxylate ABC transporter permease [Acuticoccus sediminis]|uniref:TRAP transporter large permease protein n=1 Tax=Acuticoccus sediminis TaxID=2184697 RepID=A0A8B2NRN8_9HYPH|nr:TRAP transporter large permease [Acuticoccus sediminis]RAH97790.1 C4-dicarboxylate ABC transporter permease [Acuticoccus sediminis]
MDPFLTALLLLAVVFIALGAGIWIFSGLMVAALFCFLVLLDFPLVRVGSIAKPIIFKGVVSFELAAVPLFIWMGEIISRTNVSAMLFQGLAPWVNRLPGGLLHANVGGSVLFSALSGSSVATTATIGRVTSRELFSRGYDQKLTLGSITVAGTIGIMIPPSITLIVYGLIAEVSVARLFAAGVLPGIMLGALYSSYIAAAHVVRPSLNPPTAETFTWADRRRGLLRLLPTVILVIFLLGSIYGGFATPSESAAVGVLGALVIAHFSGGITLRDIYDSAMSAVLTTAMIGSAVAGAALLASAIGFLHLPQLVSEAIAALQLSPMMLLLVLTIVYVLLGAVLDGISMILMTVPITLPLLVANGFDPVWIGVYLVLMVEVGMVTPPIGFNLFVLRGITGIPIGRIALATFPFFLLMLLGGLLLAAFPGIALWLPSLL